MSANAALNATRKSTRWRCVAHEFTNKVKGRSIMTFYLKTCYAYVLILVCINIVLLGFYLNSLSNIDKINDAKIAGDSNYPDTCEAARFNLSKVWIDHYCTFDAAIAKETFLQYTLLFFHLVFDVIIFFWINSREGWLGWKSCERQTKSENSSS